MSNRTTHEMVGTLAGGAWTLFRLPPGSPPGALIEVIGGLVGGRIGAQIPDWLEPAFHSHHRDVWHSVTVGIVTAWAAQRTPLSIAASLRDSSIEVRARRHRAGHELCAPAATLALAMEVLLRFLAGFVVGLPAGFVSHLLCDATTRRGLPLFARGF